MNLPGFSVRRPIFTTMVTFIIILMGAVSLSRLKIDFLPDIELPRLSVTTEYEGASPEVMERLVTQILEEIIATVPGVDEVSSSSSEGRSRIRVSFGWGNDINTGAIDVQGKIEDEINELPDDIVRPRVRKFDIASFPIVILGISSSLDPVEFTELVEVQLRYRFARVPGVAQVDLFGEYSREVRVELLPDRIKAHGLPLDRVIQAIRNANVDLPAGKIEQGRFEVTLRAPAEFSSLDQIRQTVIAKQDGTAVTLDQIAEIRDTYEKRRRISRINGGRGLMVAIRKQADANTVEVAKRVLKEIEAINKAFPQVEAVPIINTGNFIERSIENVARSVLYGGGLAVLVLLFFLRNIPSTLVISLSIPISIIATFTLIYFQGLTINLMTLGGLALGVGMMVDSSIVVLENIFRRSREAGEAPVEAAVSGAREVAPAIIASTITTLVIFLPLVFVRGVAGILFKEMAYVIIFSLACSLLVSLSLSPMLASKLLKTSSKKSERKEKGWIHRLIRASDAVFAVIDNTYGDFVRWVLSHRLITVFSALAMLGLSLFLLPMIGSEFMPPSDEGEVRITGEMEVGTRLSIVEEKSKILEKLIFDAVPEITASVVSVGASGWRGGSAARCEFRLSLSPATQRKRSNTQIAADLRRRLNGKIPGMVIRVRAPQGQFLLTRLLGGDASLSVEIRGFDLQTMDLLSNQVADAIRNVPGITDVQTSTEAGMPQEEISVDRHKVADLGLSVRDVTRVLETAVAGTRVGEYRAEGNAYRIFLQLKNADQRSLDEILDLTLTTASGEQVALRNLVTSGAGRGPALIDRKDQQRIVTVDANVSERDLGSVAMDVQERLDRIPRPVGYSLMVSGSYEEQQKAFGELVISLVLALVLVFMVLACQYESFRDPVVVMFSVPFAAIGVLLTLFLTRTTLNVQSYIGCIMLGGIVVNNAILLVDQAGQLIRKGMSVTDGMAEAGRRRLRPILMTTLTTILGLLPLAFGLGEGADAQAPLARAVVGGLAGATLITLGLIPAIYSLFHPEPKGPKP